MGFTETMIFYLLIGLGVATAVYLSDARPNRLSTGFRAATAVVFWPLYLPILLAGPRPGPRPENRTEPGEDDAMSLAIARVEAELELALASLDGWVEDVLAHETGRFRELSTALARPGGADSRDGPPARPGGGGQPRPEARRRRDGGGERPIPSERAGPSCQPGPAPRGAQPGFRRPHGHADAGP